MKRVYIKPETESHAFIPAGMIAGSTNWNMQGGEGQKPEDIDPTTEPDPSSGGGAKGINLWDEY